MGGIGLLACASVLATQAARAAVVNVDNTSLASPNTAPASPTQTATSNSSWYNGTGNPQSAFEVATDSVTGIELGLRAIIRGGGPSTFSHDNSYTVSTGVGTTGKALWNYEFSIDLNPGHSAGGLTFADIGAPTLTITDLTTSVTQSYNPITFLTDDKAYGDAGNGATNVVRHSGVLGTDWGAQNSQNLGFGFPAIGFSPWAGDSYQFTLSVDGVSDTIVVDAVPEPATMAVLGVGLLGLGAARRRRR